MSAARKRPDTVNERLIEAVRGRLDADLPVRRSLPQWGRIHVDRQLPFLCVYRRPPKGTDPGTDRLVTTEASYLVSSGASRFHAGLSELVSGVADTLTCIFGAFLVVEIWAGTNHSADEDEEHAVGRPRFRVIAPRGAALGGFLDTFENALSGITIRRRHARVVVQRSARWHPKRFQPLLPAETAIRLGCTVLGLEVDPVYRDPETGEPYPVVLRQYRRALSRALRRTFFEFARRRTTQRPAHFHVLGRRAVVKAVWEIDRRLSEVSDRFDFLLQVTPVNGIQAWNRFQKDRFDRLPVFHYRPLLADPAVLKRRLFDIPVERVEDPALAFLFRQKQEEVERQITMLQDLNTRRFLLGSRQLYEDPDDKLDATARYLLERIRPHARDASTGGYLDARAFAELARTEISHYRSVWPEIRSGVEIREDVTTGLMVSRGSMLIGKNTRIPASRAEALLQHEVGTHVLTYFNGKAQPFRQLYSGLAGYETFQEGLAVLSEYMVGGLSAPRLRLLAARVVAVRMMVDGASFLDTFRSLTLIHGLSRQNAFTVTMRIYRGGGLTKDAGYLLGLVKILRYLGKGGELAPLYVGKIAREHVSIITELRWRQVLKEPPLMPRWYGLPESEQRLTYLRTGVEVQDLVKGRGK
jgi:uncharacterized protein (TIGR02421 family)